MLAAWTATSGTTSSPLLIVGLRDGAVLTYDLDRVVADPNVNQDSHYLVHESWPGRKPVTSVATGFVGGGLVTAWTTEDGWLFVEPSRDAPPLRLNLGTRILVTRVAPDATILLGGTDGVTAVRLVPPDPA
jgi:hypothetical protein